MSLTDYIVLVAVVVALSVTVLMVADVFTRRTQDSVTVAFAISRWVRW